MNTNEHEQPRIFIPDQNHKIFETKKFSRRKSAIYPELTKQKFV